MTLSTLGYSAAATGHAGPGLLQFRPAGGPPGTAVYLQPGRPRRNGPGRCRSLLNTVLLWTWFHRGLRLSHASHPALFGLLLIIIGFQTFVFTLLFHMIQQRREGQAPDSSRGWPAGP